MPWLGPTLGAGIWTLLPTAPLPHPESFGLAALFPVWQSMFALFIGGATSETRRPVPLRASEAPLEDSAPLRQTRRELGRRTFVVIVVSLLVVSLMRTIPVRLRLTHRERVAERKRESRPSALDLVAKPMSEAEALASPQTNRRLSTRPCPKESGASGP